LRVLSFISKSLVELYTLLGLGDAFFLLKESKSKKATQQNNKNKIRKTMVFTFDPFGLYNTNADDKTLEHTIRLYC